MEAIYHISGNPKNDEEMRNIIWKIFWKWFSSTSFPRPSFIIFNDTFFAVYEFDHLGLVDFYTIVVDDNNFVERIGYSVSIHSINKWLFNSIK